MATFELVLVLLLVGAWLTAVAKRIGVPYPVLLAIGGVSLALLPSGTIQPLDPQLALVLFVAPTLLDAAYDASPGDIKKHWFPIATLVFAPVILTVFTVAAFARHLLPGMTWPVAIVLGAIVAPPDASAASAVLRQLSVPHRLLVILEGESLLNDASALLVYCVAIGTVGGANVSIWSAGESFVTIWIGGAILGLISAGLYLRIIQPNADIAISVVTQFGATFGTWLLAERLGVSPILTTVVFAVTLAQSSPGRLGAHQRRITFAIWEVATFVLNALAFILIGLQLKGVIIPFDQHTESTALFASLILLTVIVVRLAWVMGFTTYLRHAPRFLVADRPPLKGSIIISWCGMRGIVTLATALGLPTGFPYRDFILSAALFVVLGTLIIHGSTIGLLIRLLKVSDDGAACKEVSIAVAEIDDAALAVLRNRVESQSALLLDKYLRSSSRMERSTLSLEIVGAQRARILSLKKSGVIGDFVFGEVEEHLDWIEISSLRKPPSPRER